MDSREVKTYLRRAKMEDCRMVYEWANDEEVRKQSFSSEKIEYESHVNWFKNKLQDKSHDYYIYMVGEDCVGQVRVARECNVGRISYSIDDKFRYKGHGSKMLLLLEAEYAPGFCLEGEVKFENTSSRSCFIKLGYSEILEEDCVLYRKVLGTD